MARIAGIDLPKQKKAFIGLTYIYGIGQHTALEILEKAAVDPNKKVVDLTEEEVAVEVSEIEEIIVIDIPVATKEEIEDFTNCFSFAGKYI